MLKQILCFFTIPALLMSFPLWANDKDINMTLTGPDLDSATHFKMFNTPGDDVDIIRNQEGPFLPDQIISWEREEDVLFRMTYQSRDSECTVEGRDDNVIPLMYDSAKISVTLNGTTLDCEVTLPVVSEKSLLMVTEVAMDANAGILTVLDYSLSNEVLNEGVYPVPAMGATITHDIYIDTAYSFIKSSTATNPNCAFSDGTQKISNLTTVYVDILDDRCTLSTTDSSDPAALPIATCQALQNIHDLTADYVLTADLYCSDINGDGKFHSLSTFTGTLTSQGCDVNSNAVCNKKVIYDLNIEQPSAGSDIGLFKTISSARIAHIAFNNATVTAREDFDRGLIAGLATESQLSDITVNTLSVLNDGTSSNAPGASGGILGIAYNTLLTGVRLAGNEVKIHKNQYAGGLIGIAHGSTHITLSSVQNLNSGNDYLNCYSGKSCGFGGLIGYASNANAGAIIDISRSFAQGKIDAKDSSGGIVGLIAADAAVHIMNSYSIVHLQCDAKCNFSGGLIGQAQEGDSSTVVQDVYIGYVFAAGKIDASGDNGGGKAIVGVKTKENKNPSKRVKAAGQSYFDTEKTHKNNAGDTFSVGLGNNGMKNVDHYTQWDDVNIWNIVQGKYPTLK